MTRLQSAIYPVLLCVEWNLQSFPERLRKVSQTSHDFVHAASPADADASALARVPPADADAPAIACAPPDADAEASA